MKLGRKQLIESLVTGDINNLLRESECKYFFSVFIVENQNGVAEYKLTVTGRDITGRDERSGMGDWQDALTKDEIRYIEFCARIDRFCIFMVT